MPDPTPVLSVNAVSKEFSGVRVLNAVSLTVAAGEIFGIIGENGAGKSTLLKIISGVYTPTEGSLSVGEVPVTRFDPQVAKSLGVTMIPQEFNLVGDLTVFENIFLGQEQLGRFGLLNKRYMRERSRVILEGLNASYINPSSQLDSLSAAQRQMVEIAKAIVNEKSRIIIMDEPTTVLNQTEVEILFNTIRDLKARGVAVIYVSHKLREVKAVCDRVLVLRDGNFISVDPVQDLDEVQMASRMVGRELTQVFPPKSVPTSEPALEVENVTVPGLLRNITFTVQRGEVFGLAGLMGAGRTETAETLIGIIRRSTGRVRVRGVELASGRPQEAVAAGLAYLSEDRQGKGILVKADMVENICLSSLRFYAQNGFISNRRRRQAAGKYVDRFSIRAANLAANLEFFSGGNQQKVSLSKCLDTHPKVIIFDEPTRGIDIKAKSDIYNFIQSLAGEGLACILISSELEEVIGLCHRVAVLHEGEITGILEGKDLTEEEIMLYATRLKTTPGTTGGESPRQVEAS
ncbi:MAG: sugar ABC transporter ATP-binding protein [Planctomycetota bacterium]|jgi:ribose transport system ATP-binding protein|nr:sugar ABC transporter ATP-binding protein [Planctomycetota bacterium]